MSNQSELIITNKYFFKCDENNLPSSLSQALLDIEAALKNVKIDSYKKSHEKSKGNLFSPVDLNEKIKKILNAKGMRSKKIVCDYSKIDKKLQENIASIENFFIDIKNKNSTISSSDFKASYQTFFESMTNASVDLISPTTAWSRLTKGFESFDDQVYPPVLLKNGTKFSTEKFNDGDTKIIPYVVSDFVGFREIDFIYEHSSADKVGIEVQFGKYAFMVYNVCAKMKIFQRSGLINYGIEIVPSKRMQKFMSTGVSFFEQFVWDLNNRGAFAEDVPVVVIAIEPNQAGFSMLSSADLKEVSISRSV